MTLVKKRALYFPNDTWQSCVTWSHRYHHYLHFLHQRLCLLPRPRHLVPRYRSLLCSLYLHLRTSKWSGFNGYLRIKISINRPFPSYPACASVSKRVLQQTLSSVNEFDFHESELPGETLFHMNGFVRGLVSPQIKSKIETVGEWVNILFTLGL